MNPADYYILLRRMESSDGYLFEASVREFPDATEYAETATEAYELALETIAASLEVLVGLGRSVPTPRANNQ